MATEASMSDAPSRRTAQELGRKGLETRRRLMVAAHTLLQSMSAVSLTATAIAREAKTSSATFYVYFDDVSDVVLALATEASDELQGVMAAVLADWNEGLSAVEGATAFFNAFRSYWNEHRAILSIRNMEADRGDARFMEIRAEAGRQVIWKLGALIAPGPESGPAWEEAVARSIVIYAAIERLAATATHYPERVEGFPSADTLAAAQIMILAQLVESGGPGGA